MFSGFLIQTGYTVDKFKKVGLFNSLKIKFSYIWTACKEGTWKVCLYCVLSYVKTDILDGHHGNYKTVIVCQSVAEVSELVQVLQSQCCRVLEAHEDMTQYQICGKYTCVETHHSKMFLCVLIV